MLARFEWGIDVSDQAEAGPEKTGIEYIDNPFTFSVRPNQRNHWSTAGVVFAVLFWPLGVVLCVVGLIKARKRGDVGQTSALIGLGIAVLAAAATILYVLSPNRPDYSKDPGCVAVSPMLADLQQNLHNDVDQAVTSPTTIPGIITGIQTDSAQFRKAAAVAVNPTLKDELNDAATRAEGYVTVLQGVEAGNQTMKQQLVNNTTGFDFSLPQLDHVCRVSVEN